ncbi:hypothetical protein K461DRAFT_325179 [Myriangium duriaei CBS 260.36]|uniref:Uncharacterized protein n=1 Tax=Myriangium duriaei CBS 260.36 TaxID=1168546 RepID=A0A9P4MCE0_9PEZI|nr:hypothetical protein K461DRAFT_325179 [Myriangium duriaei CBS 260.36]
MALPRVRRLKFCLLRRKSKQAVDQPGLEVAHPLPSPLIDWRYSILPSYYYFSNDVTIDPGPPPYAPPPSPVSEMPTTELLLPDDWRLLAERDHQLANASSFTNVQMISFVELPAWEGADPTSNHETDAVPPRTTPLDQGRVLSHHRIDAQLPQLNTPVDSESAEGSSANPGTTSSLPSPLDHGLVNPNHAANSQTVFEDELFTGDTDQFGAASFQTELSSLSSSLSEAETLTGSWDTLDTVWDETLDGSMRSRPRLSRMATFFPPPATAPIEQGRRRGPSFWHGGLRFHRRGEQTLVHGVELTVTVESGGEMRL